MRMLHGQHRELITVFLFTLLIGFIVCRSPSSGSSGDCHDLQQQSQQHYRRERSNDNDIPTNKVVQPTSSLPPRRDLFFDETPRDGEVVLAKRGSDVVLDCQAIGTPLPTIHWLHRGRRIIQGERHDVRDDMASYESGVVATNPHESVLRLGTTKSRLFIDCVRPSDAGIYTCVAETPTLRITTTIVLRVVRPRRRHRKLKEHRARNSPLKNTEMNTRMSNSSDRCHINRERSDNAPARIYMWTSQRLAETSQQAQLYCRASGSPPPTVTWYDPDEREIRPDDRQYKVLPNGDLLISDVAWPDNMGLYYCKVQNSGGSDVVDMFVYPTTT